MQIEAAVLRDPAGPLVIETLELAAPGPHEVLVRIVGAGMCHTDVLPRVGYAPTPIVTGHEGSGVVEVVGSAVTSVAVGDHVVLSFDSCRECANCLAGQPAYCATFMPRNLSGRNLDGTTGSILVAMKVQPGTSLVVFGAGAVGLAAVMAGVVAGATTIIAVDLQQHRLALALELGATHTFHGNDADLLGEIQRVTGGGAQYSFDTTGVPAVMKTALACLRMTGVCGYVGVQLGDLVLDGSSLVGKTAIGILEGSVDPQVFIPRMIELWQAGRFPFDRLIEQYPMSRINEAEASSLAGGTIKPVLIPGS